MIDAPGLPFQSPFDRSEESPLDRLLLALMRRSSDVAIWRPRTPWSLVRRGTTIDVRLNRLYEEEVADPANRELLMACGAVIENVRIAANRQGRSLDVTAFPEPRDRSLVARLCIERAVSPRQEDEALYGLIVPRRRTARPHGGHAMSPALIAVLRHAARSCNGWLDVIADDARREMLADLELEAAIIADAERGAKRLAHWRTPSPFEEHEETILVRGGGPGIEELLSTLGGRITPRHDWGMGLAHRVRSAAIEAPLLVVLGTSGDAPEDWLAAGSALQRVLLHASVQGLGATFMNGPVHNPLVRHALRSLLFAGGSPQAIVRFEFDEDESRDATRGLRLAPPRI